MNIQVRGHHLEITDALRDYVVKRIGKLDKFFEHIHEANVTLSVERGMNKVEVTMPCDGIVLRGEESQNDMYAAIDLVMEKLERQIDKYKTRLSKSLKEVGFKDFSPTEFHEPEAPSIIKSKRFALKPMDVEEAVMQMNLIGHSFFVFSNSDTEEVNVVYKRKDGNYGLIEPTY